MDIGTTQPSAAANGERWLRSRNRLVSPRLRLVCLPYAGGGATVFHHWADAFPSDVEVRVVQLPGRQDRLVEPALQSVAQAVDGIAAALPMLAPAPLVLYGHSYGAILAFELAAKLRHTALRPRALVVAARRAPHLPMSGVAMSALPDAEFKELLHLRYGMPRSVLDNHALMEIAMPTLRADFTAVETYQYVPAAPLEIPITALHGMQDPLVSREEMAAWGQVSALPLRFHEVDAGHFFVDTHRDWVITKVAAALREAS